MEDPEGVENAEFEQNALNREFWGIVDADVVLDGSKLSVPLSVEMQDVSRSIVRQSRRRAMDQRLRRGYHTLRYPFNGYLRAMIKESRAAKVMCAGMAAGSAVVGFWFIGAAATDRLEDSFEAGSNDTDQGEIGEVYEPFLTDEMILERDAAFNGDSPKDLYERTFIRTFTDASGPSFRYGQTCLSRTPYDTSSSMGASAAGVVYDYANNRVVIVPENTRLPELQFSGARETSQLVEPYGQVTKQQLEAYGCEDILTDGS